MMIKCTAHINLMKGIIVVPIMGTTDTFRYGEYFEIVGTEGNIWIFKIDDVIEAAKKCKNKNNIKYAAMIERDCKSNVGLKVAFPLAMLINDLANELGKEVIVKLNRADKNEL